MLHDSEDTPKVPLQHAFALQPCESTGVANPRRPESDLIERPIFRTLVCERARHHLAEQTPGKLASLIVLDLRRKWHHVTEDQVQRALALEATALKAALSVLEEGKRIYQQTIEDHSSARREKWHRRNVIPIRRAA